jgi:hypothetical protein
MCGALYELLTAVRYAFSPHDACFGYVHVHEHVHVRANIGFCLAPPPPPLVALAALFVGSSAGNERALSLSEPPLDSHSDLLFARIHKGCPRLTMAW